MTRKLVPLRMVLDEAEADGIDTNYLVVDPDDVASIDPDDLEDEKNQEENPED